MTMNYIKISENETLLSINDICIGAVATEGIAKLITDSFNASAFLFKDYKEVSQEVKNLNKGTN